MAENRFTMSLVARGWALIMGAAAAQAAFGKEAGMEHPCVLINRERLPALRAKAGAAAVNRFGFAPADAWAKIKAKADRFVRADPYSYSVDIPLPGGKHAGVWEYTLSDKTPPRHDDTPRYPPWTAMFQERADSITTRLMHLSFAYLITGEAPYLERARRIALNLSKWDYWTDPSYGGGRLKACLDTGHCTYAMGMFYDWCFDGLSEANRAQIRNAIIEKGIQACLAGVDRYPPDTNGYAVILSGAVLAAIAVRPETPEAREWLEQCIEKIRVSLDRGGKDGGAFEGPMYGTYLLDSFAKAFDALEAAGVKHDLFDHPYLATMERYCIGLLAPDTRQIPCFSDGSPTAGYPQLMDIIAHRGSKAAAWYLREIGAVEITGIYDFIRFDESRLDPVRPEWNPSSVFVDIGYASLRNGFDRESPALFFKAGPYENNIGHNHFDQNAFVISYGGEWIIPDRGYHSRYDPRERKFSLGTLGHCTVVLDADEAYMARTKVADLGHEQVRKNGARITEFFAGTNFDFVKGEAAEAYNTPERTVLTRFDRSIVFVKPHFFVIYDRLAAPEPHSFNFLLHTDGLGTIEQKDGDFVVSRTTGQVWGRTVASVAASAQVGTYPGAERYGPFLRVATEPVREASFATVLYPRTNPDPSFLRNGGFEQGMAGWRPRANQDLPNHAIVEDGAAAGKKCARVEKSGYYYSAKFKRKPGTRVTAYAKIRTTELPEGKGATMTLYFWGGGKSFARKRVGPFAHTKWREHSVTATVPEGTEQVCLALEFFAPGTAWFDDARIESDEAEGAVARTLTPRISALDAGALTVELGPERWLLATREAGEGQAAHGLTTDADLAVVGLNAAGEPASVFLQGGTVAALAGREIVRLDRPGTVEARLEGSALDLRVAHDITPHAPLPESVRLTTGWRPGRARVNGRAAKVLPREGTTTQVLLE